MNRWNLTFAAVAMAATSLLMVPAYPAAAEPGSETPVTPPVTIEATPQATPAASPEAVPSPAPAPDAARQAALTAALADLDRALPKLDPETRKQESALRAIFRRAVLEHGSLTKPESDLYNTLRHLGSSSVVQSRDPGTKTRDFDPKGTGSLNKLGEGQVQIGSLYKLQLLAMPGIKFKPTIRAGQRRIPGHPGAAIGYVTLRLGDREKTVAEIPTDAGGMSPLQRARRVAYRMQTATRQSGLWWTELSVEAMRGESIVSAPQAPGGLVITADLPFARIRQTAPPLLATRVMHDIRYVYGGQPILVTRDPRDPQEALAAASEYREKGDAAYDTGDTAGAESWYRKSIDRRADYALAYERLADLYAERNDATRRQEIARRALTLTTLDPPQRQKFEALSK